MKKILLTSTILASAAFVSSASAASNPTRLDSLFFLTEKGGVVGAVSYGETGEKYKNDNSNAGTYPKVHTRDKEINANARYGISDKLMLGLSMSYVSSREQDGSGNARVYHDKGVSNPKIDLTYRVANQADNGAFTDLRFAYVPDLIALETSDYDSGNGRVDNPNYRGGNVYNFGVSYGRDIAEFSYKLNVDANYVGDRNYKMRSAGGKDRYSQDSRTNLIVGLDTQYRVSDMASLNLGASREMKSSYTDETNTVVSEGNVNKYKAAVNFGADPEKCLITIAYEYANIENKKSGGSVTQYANSSQAVKVGYTHKF